MRIFTATFVVLASASTAAAQQPDTVIARQYAAIGQVEGAPEYLFGDIRAVAEDASRRIWVADRIGSTVRAYTASGEFIRQLGGEGRGPGEYQWPLDIRFRRDTAWVRDGVRLTVLVPRAPGALADSVIETRQLPGYGNTSSRAAAVTGDGTYFYPAYIFPFDGTPRHFYLRHTGSGWAPDTLELPPFASMMATRSASYRVGERSGRMLHGLNAVPFAPAPRWDVTARGTIISGDGRSYELRETDRSGRIIRRIGRDVPMQPIPEAERRDSLQALRARIDSIPVPLDRVLNMPEEVRELRLPATLPAFIDVTVATNGSTWVRRWPRAGRRESIWDVFDDTGRFIRTVVVPLVLEPLPPPYVTGQTLIGVIRDDETGVQRVVAFRFDLAPPRR